MLRASEFQLNSDVSDIVEVLMQQYNFQLHENPKSRIPLALSYAQKIPLIRQFLPSADAKKQQIAKLLEEQKSAPTYSKWYEVSLELDELMGNNVWKLNPESSLYDYELIHKFTQEMRDARVNQDYKLLLYLIRTKWVRNIGNIGDNSLYKHSFVGTKKLVEDYISECKAALNFLVNETDVNLDDRYLLGMLIQTRKNIGRTALVLSGGSVFGMFHIGVLVSLLEVNLLPRIISGSSAGSIIAAIICCHNNEENKKIIELLGEKEFEVFRTEETDEKANQFRALLKSVGHFLKYGTIFEMEGLKNTIIGFVGNLTFREAYNRTGRILNITVSPASLHEQTRLLNYLTAPNCLIWSAVCASCSLPGIFPSTSIYEKNPKTNKIQKWNGDSSIKFVDGSVDNDLPITRLLEMFNVDHIIAVQVNPHVVPFLKISVSNPGGFIEDDLTTRFKGMLNNAYDFFASEFIHYFQILNEMDIYKNLSTKLISLLSQNYSGDITILPELHVSDLTKIFVNPTPEFIADFIVRGARSTWPKLTLINNHCGVEFELDKAISTLRGRTLHAKSFKNSLIINPINTKEAIKDDDPLEPKSPEIALRKEPVTPERRRVNSQSKTLPKIKRHNSGGYPTKLLRKQRNSISNFLSFHSIQSAKQAAPVQPPTSAPVKKEKERVPMSETVTHVRKTRSSASFQRDDSPEDKKSVYDRISQWENNPYVEPSDDTDRPVEYRISTENSNDEDDDYDARSCNLKPSVHSQTSKEENERANLPKRSHNSSMANSYIGLNRLKDANVLKDSSTLMSLEGLFRDEDTEREDNP